MKSLMEQFLENKTQVEQEIGRNVDIDSVCFYDNGKIEYKVFTKDILHELRSISKVIVLMAIGIAMDKKMKLRSGEVISMNTKFYDTFSKMLDIKEENVERIKKLTMFNMMTYSCGFGKQMFSQNEIDKIEDKDYLKYILNYDFQNEIGEFEYNNAEFHLLAIFFKEEFNIEIIDFIYEHIFKPLDILDFTWDRLNNICRGATGLYLKNEDLFKISLLVLKKGVYNNKRIISEQFINDMCSMQINTLRDYNKDRTFPKMGVGYGMHISTNGFVFKDGTWGQNIVMNFDRDICFSVTANDLQIKNVENCFKFLYK